MAKGNLECVSPGPRASSASEREPARDPGGAEPGTARCREPGSADTAPSGCPVGQAPAHDIAENVQEEVSAGNLSFRGRAALSGREPGALHCLGGAAVPGTHAGSEQGTWAALGTASLSPRVCSEASPPGGRPQSPFDWGPHPLLHPTAPGRPWVA